MSNTKMFETIKMDVQHQQEWDKISQTTMYNINKAETKCPRQRSLTLTMPRQTTSPRQTKCLIQSKCLRQIPQHMLANARKSQTSMKLSMITNSEKLPSLSLSQTKLSINIKLERIHVREHYVCSNSLTKTIIEEETKTQHKKSYIYFYSFQQSRNVNSGEFKEEFFS